MVSSKNAERSCFTCTFYMTNGLCNCFHWAEVGEENYYGERYMMPVKEDFVCPDWHLEGTE